MKHILLALPFLVIFTACSSSSNKISPKFYGTFFTGLETENITTYKAAKLDYDLTSPNGKNIHFSTCLQVDALKDTDIAANEYPLFTMLKINCKALKHYTESKASSASYIDELLVNKDIKNLPATAYPFVNDYDESIRLNKTLSEFHKKLETKTLDDGSIDVLTNTDTLLYQIISTGDFNADSILDVIIRIDWHVLNAFGKGSKLIMISKLGENTHFIELDIH